MAPAGVPPFTGLRLPLAVVPGAALAGPAWWWDPARSQYLPAVAEWDCGRAYWVHPSVFCDMVLGD